MKRGKSTRGSKEVAGIGMGSVAHQIAIQAVTAATMLPLRDRTDSVSPSSRGRGISGRTRKSSRPRSGPAKKPIARERVVSLLKEEPDIDIVGECADGREALAAIESTRPDLLFLDVQMPEMDGLETMREIRKIARLKNLPIVAVTAKAMKGDREKCIEAGAWDYLSKPVDTEQMLAVLRAWLHR